MLITTWFTAAQCTSLINYIIHCIGFDSNFNLKKVTVIIYKNKYIKYYLL